MSVGEGAEADGWRRSGAEARSAEYRL